MENPLPQPAGHPAFDVAQGTYGKNDRPLQTVNLAVRKPGWYKGEPASLQGSFGS